MNSPSIMRNIKVLFVFEVSSDDIWSYPLLYDSCFRHCKLTSLSESSNNIGCQQIKRMKYMVTSCMFEICFKTLCVCACAASAISYQSMYVCRLIEAGQGIFEFQSCQGSESHNCCDTQQRRRLISVCTSTIPRDMFPRFL